MFCWARAFLSKPLTSERPSEFRPPRMEELQVDSLGCFDDEEASSWGSENEAELTFLAGFTFSIVRECNDVHLTWFFVDLKTLDSIEASIDASFIIIFFFTLVFFHFWEFGASSCLWDALSQKGFIPLRGWFWLGLLCPEWPAGQVRRSSLWVDPAAWSGLWKPCFCLQLLDMAVKTHCRDVSAYRKCFYFASQIIKLLKQKCCKHHMTILTFLRQNFDTKHLHFNKIDFILMLNIQESEVLPAHSLSFNRIKSLGSQLQRFQVTRETGLCCVYFHNNNRTHDYLGSELNNGCSLWDSSTFP